MKNFLARLNYKFRLFMRGRYGFDTLSYAAVILGVVLSFLSGFTTPILYYISLPLIFWAYFRCFSKNLDKRGRELCAYLKLKNKLNASLTRHKKMFAERKTHRFFKCPKCGTYSRVPKGKGKIKITCGVCKTQMIKKT